MKINTFKKVAVSTMAIAMGAALVGSISGSIAWYQYSTRSTVSYSGASAHCTESLQVRLPAVAASFKLTEDATVDALKTYYTREGSTGRGIDDDGEYHYNEVASPEDAGLGSYNELVKQGAAASEWGSDLRAPDVRTYLFAVRGVADYNLRPVTSGALAANAVATTFKKEPIYQQEGIVGWSNATNMDYVTLPLQFRVRDVNGGSDTFLAKNVYLSDLQMADISHGAKADITPALRVGFDGTNDRTYSLNGTDVNAYGNLDIGGDAGLDIREEYDYYAHRTVVADLAAANALPEKEEGDIAELADFSQIWQYQYVTDHYEWVDITAENPYVLYGVDGEVAHSTELAAANLADDSDPYNIEANGALLGVTTTNGEVPLEVTVRIYLEGWKPLAGSAVWNDEYYVGSAFKVNMRFSVDAHNNNE